MRMKDASRIFNSATAFLVMAEAAELYCDWLERAGDMDDAAWLQLHEQLRAQGMAGEIERPASGEAEHRE